MARTKVSEQPRVRSKSTTAAAIDELTRGAGDLKEFLSQVEDLGREGFPYIDAARARADLQFRECIRRTFGEKSPEFQAHRQHRLLMGSPEETQQSIALIKALIATLDQKKLELQGGAPPQQAPVTPPDPPIPVGPQLTLVPTSISTVQMTMTQAEPIVPAPVAVAMTTSLGLAPVTVVPSSPPVPPLPPVPSHKPEILSDSIPAPTASPIPPAEIVTAAPLTHPQLATPVVPDPQPLLPQASQLAKTGVSQAGRPQQPSQPESEPIVHPISPAKQQSKIQESSPVLPYPLPSIPSGSSLSHQEPAPQLAQAELTPVELVKTLCYRFHSVARQLRLRGEQRATLSVEDETDVQDLLHALLRIQFDDIDTEEWTPSYGEGATRTTFLLNDNQLAVLVKKTRNGLAAKDLTEQLRIDAERYLTKSRCTSLLCFIYDPDGRIGNPRAFETTLTTVNGSLTIDVLIAPK